MKELFLEDFVEDFKLGIENDMSRSARCIKFCLRHDKKHQKTLIFIAPQGPGWKVKLKF